ncbi:hypothetical protein [Natronoglycomyces albus]|uniref:Uncharacterized protein n=1 Tax=Natronoglycomyces albus TaxID=2811108 RepID=A0A895XP69_9ACTN|nr:hypothetical protein [Natronoglycomyces albus]QSB07154.1 hypothetical protein JQS30_17075 [Natronoglycomyces albus]
MNLTGFRAKVDGVIAQTETAAMPEVRREIAQIAVKAVREGTSAPGRMEIRPTGHGLTARVDALHLAAALTGTNAEATSAVVYALTGPSHALDYAAELYRLFDTQLTWSADALGADINPPEVLENFLSQVLKNWVAQTRCELAIYLPAATEHQSNEDTMNTETQTHWHSIMLEQISPQGVHPMVNPPVDTRDQAHDEIQTNLDRLATKDSRAASVANRWRQNTTPAPGQTEPLINWEIFGWTLLECTQANCRDSVQELLDTIAARVTNYTGLPFHVPQLPADWPNGATS